MKEHHLSSKRPHSQQALWVSEKHFNMQPWDWRDTLPAIHCIVHLIGGHLWKALQIAGTVVVFKMGKSNLANGLKSPSCCFVCMQKYKMSRYSVRLQHVKYIISSVTKLETGVLGRVSADLVCTFWQKTVKIAVLTKDCTILLELCLEWSSTETIFVRLCTIKMPIVTYVINDLCSLTGFPLQS